MQTIPKIIHQIWAGETPLPDAFKELGETWKEHHPDWEYRLWNESDMLGFIIEYFRNTWIYITRFISISSVGMPSGI